MAFFEFNIAMTGLFAAQRGLQVTSNNITNTNTTGYSRQEIKQQASRPLSGIGVGMTGTGVDVTGLNRVRDSYIDQKLWSQNPKLGEYNVKVTQNSMIEVAFGEPSEKGFTAVFNDLFNAISNLSLNPSAADNKAVLKQEMIKFTKYFNNISSTLKKYQQDLNFDFKNTVNSINSLSTRIASLNDQIMNAEIYGDEASSFRDERDNCLDELSKLINIEVEEDEYEVSGNTITKMRVKAAGQVLVDHIQGNTLDIVVRKNNLNRQDVDGLYDVVWSNGLSFEMNDENMSGELKAIIDVRDGCGTDGVNKYCGIPYYIKRIDEYVQKFAKKMNQEYSKNNTSSTDYAMFSFRDDSGIVSAGALNDYSKMTAEKFTISREIDDKIDNMRTLFDKTNPSDTSFMLNLLAQKDNKSMFEEGDPKDYMVAIFSELGINAKEAGMYQNTQKAVVNNLTNQRLSVSQVDITEEFTYLMKYQQAYQASAKIMTTIDGIYETTIFKLGNF